MRLPRHSLQRNPGSLREMVETSRREKEARELHSHHFDLGELMLQVRSRDTFGKTRVRRCIPARRDEDLVELVDRILEEAAAGYSRLRMQWQRQLVGYLTSLGAEARARLGEGPLEAPCGLDYLGLEAQGEPGMRISIRVEEAGDHCGLKARYLNLRAGRVGDHCLTHSHACTLAAGIAGHFLGERSEGIVIDAGEAGDWLLLKSRGASADVRRVGRLAGLDSHDLELHVDKASYELGARARNAVIYVRRGVLTMGLSGSGVVYLAPGIGHVRTCFEIRPLVQD